MSWTIHADVGRESRVIAQLTKLMKDDDKLPKETQLSEIRMYTADFGISFGDKLLAIIERKTWEDLAATIKDRERSSNHKKLINARDKVIRDYEVDCKVYYIIEGPSAFPRDKVAGIAANCFTGFFNKVIINDNCHVLYTDSHEGTAARILSLVKSYDKLRDAGLLRNIEPKEKPRVAASSSATSRAPGKSTQSRVPRAPPVAIATSPNITSASAIQAMLSANDEYDSDFSYDIDGGDDDEPISSQSTFAQPPRKLPTKPVVRGSRTRKPCDDDVIDNDSSESEESNTTAGTNLTSVTNVTVATNKTNALTERPNELSLEAKRDKCLLAMKSGITEKNIEVIREFGIKKIILGKVTKAALEKKTIGGKKLGAGIITKILEIPKDHSAHVKLLNGITGVSKELAENILTSYSVADLYKIDSSALAAFKRNYGQFKPIGVKLATDITRIIDC